MPGAQEWGQTGKGHGERKGKGSSRAASGEGNQIGRGTANWDWGGAGSSPAVPLTACMALEKSLSLLIPLPGITALACCERRSCYEDKYIDDHEVLTYNHNGDQKSTKN